jgi:hypothetical protein
LGDEASLEVTSEGDLVFVVPPNPQGRMAARSRAAQLLKTWDAVKPTLFTVLRIAFGVGLFVSIAVVYTAIFAIFTSSSSDSRDDDRNDRRRSRGDMGGMGGGLNLSILNFGPSPFDIFYYRPYYSYSRGGAVAADEMGLLESIYSYVFGDGDSNFDLSERAVAAAAQVIRAAGGVVTAQELAPFVPAPPPSSSLSSSVVDEQFVLPLVTRLEGVASVTADGDIVYTFDDVMLTTASAGSGDGGGFDGGGGGGSSGDPKPGGPLHLEERPVRFSRASSFNLFLSGALGVVNLVGVAVLTSQLATLPPASFPELDALLPFVSAYAVAFNLFPALRAFQVLGLLS